ncbi:MAG: hypothetical protein KDD35_06315 [Bdellovibrionales bacterium]|nr:hypothetical protein [Bdellovibrionales bacterium]
MTEFENMRKTQARFLLIQWAFTLVTLVLVIWLVSCTKEPKVEKAELGPQVSLSEINGAIESAMGGRSPLETRVGDQALYETNQRIETGEVTKLKEVLSLVREREENEHFVIYHIEDTTISFEGEQSESLRSETEWRIAKISLPQLPTLGNHSALLDFRKADLYSPSSVFSKFSIFPNKQEAPSLSKSPPITFHNLKLFSDRRPPPTAVREDPECRQLSSCELQTTEMSFDLVEWPSPDNWKTTQYRYVYALNTPYPAHLVLLCVKQLIDTQKRDYLVSQCQILRDFSFGPQ